MRIRTIKPEFWRSPDVAALDDFGRLLFIGLWNYVDDHGRGVWDARLIRADLFPLDERKVGQIEAGLAALRAAGLIQRYEVDGRSYLLVCTFAEHQIVNRPSRSRFPEPTLTEGSVSAHGVVTEGSVPEQGTGSREVEQGEPVVGLAPDDEGATARIFAAWIEATSRTGATVLNAKRRQLIRAALKCYPEADLLDAVRGWRHFPHNRGENERRTPYHDIELLLRDAAHIERFRDAERAGGVPRQPQLTRVQRLMAERGLTPPPDRGPIIEAREAS